MIYFHLILLQVENWCPRLPWRAKNPNEETDQKTVVRKSLKHKNSSVLLFLQKILESCFT